LNSQKGIKIGDKVVSKENILKAQARLSVFTEFVPEKYPNDPPLENVNPEYAILTSAKAPLKLLFDGVLNLFCTSKSDKFEETKNYIQKNGRAPDGYKGGRTLQNDGRLGSQVLPKFDKKGQPITYREWDVDPKPTTPGVCRNKDRLVSGSDGTFWKTKDHYKTFKKMK